MKQEIGKNWDPNQIQHVPQSVKSVKLRLSI